MSSIKDRIAFFNANKGIVSNTADTSQAVQSLPLPPPPQQRQNNNGQKSSVVINKKSIFQLRTQLNRIDGPKLADIIRPPIPPPESAEVIRAPSCSDGSSGLIEETFVETSTDNVKQLSIKERALLLDRPIMDRNTSGFNKLNGQVSVSKPLVTNQREVLSAIRKRDAALNMIEEDETPAICTNVLVSSEKVVSEEAKSDIRQRGALLNLNFSKPPVRVLQTSGVAFTESESSAPDPQSNLKSVGDVISSIDAGLKHPTLSRPLSLHVRSRSTSSIRPLDRDIIEQLAES